MIFDEYHELICEAPLFATFINLMKTRHIYTNSQTLLLSATPTLMNFLWDVEDGKRTILLPNNMDTVHNGDYQITVGNNIIPMNSDSLTIFNSIRKAQEHRRNVEGILIHSNFLNIDIQALTKQIYDIYGKINRYSINKPNVISAPIIQASMDISFNGINESVLSPEASLQRLGRNDRWGSLKKLNITPKFNIVDMSNDPRERGLLKPYMTLNYLKSGLIF